MIVYTDNQHYSDIADAIREKTGDTETEYNPSEMAAAIENIPSGGGTDGYFKPLKATEFITPKMILTYNGEEY